jgi:cyclopropane fatty-acyl-phospholipid synthase-like methyltransferase
MRGSADVARRAESYRVGMKSAARWIDEGTAFAELEGKANGRFTFVAPGEASIACEALALAGLRAGDRFLDVAAGPGGLTLPAARLGAKVVATDWSPKMSKREGVGDTGARHGLPRARLQRRLFPRHRLALRRHAHPIA